jgi:GNAT superfamily N-acetyltransferase
VITIRRLAPSDSIPEMTGLLHRAYAKQMAMGLKPLAGRQDDSVTKKRVFAGECYVAVEHVPLQAGKVQQRIVGTILFHEVEEAEGPPWFTTDGVASFSQFAVDPDLQGHGIGASLLEKVEARTVETGCNELACSMAEPDTDLLNWYIKRGYRFVEHWQWPYTNYRSAILSKKLR